MVSFTSRELMAYSEDQIHALPDGPLTIVFDDATELFTTARATILSWYFWEFFRIDQGVPMKDKHHVGNKDFTQSLQLKLLGECMTEVILYRKRRGEPTVLPVSEYWRVGYEVINRIYNFVANNLEDYVVTIDADDVLEVLDHPTVMRFNKEVKPYYESIKTAQDGILKVLKDQTELDGNRIAEAVRCALVSDGQVAQCFGPIGLRTAVDSTVFPIPVTTNFSEGLVSLYDSMVESRSASKALMFTKTPLQKVQYYNREIQLEAGVVMNLHHDTDCGSKVTVPYFIKTAKVLDELQGKYYVKDDGTLAVITAKDVKDKTMIGTTVQLRSIRGCMHPDEQGVCSTCYGVIALSVPEGANVGHTSCVELNKNVTQITLSTKHLDSGVKVEDFIIQPADEPYLSVADEDGRLRLRKKLKERQAKLKFHVLEAPNLAQLEAASDLSMVSSETIASMSEVRIRTERPSGGYLEFPVTVSMGSRKASFTFEFMAYMKEKGVLLADSGMYMVDLADWDFSLPVFRLPLKHRSMLEFKTEVEQFIKAAHTKTATSPLRRCGKPTDPADFGSVLAQFHDIVGTKLSVNIVHLEVLLYSTMIRSKANNDYRLPKPRHKAEFAPYTELMRMRSLAPAMAYQAQVETIHSISSYLDIQRPASPMDPILKG